MAELIERQAAIKAAEHAYNEWNLAMAAADGQRQINRVFKMQELCKAVISVFEDVPAVDLDCTGCVWLNTRHRSVPAAGGISTSKTTTRRPEHEA